MAKSKKVHYNQRSKKAGVKTAKRIKANHKILKSLS